jgi:hypothetical protein
MELHMNYDEVKEYWKDRTNLKISDDKIQRILYAYRNGSTQKLAAQYAGITVNTLKNWIKKGQTLAEQLEAGTVPIPEDEYIFIEIWAKISELETNLQIQAFNQIQEAASMPEHWRAAVEILKMRFGNEYSTNKTDLEISNEAQVPFSVKMTINKDCEHDN